MTMTLDNPALVTPPAQPARLWRVARLHLTNPLVLIGIPWIIVGVAFAIMLALTAILNANGIPPAGLQYSWAVLSPQWYMVAVGVQAIGLTFSFALGFGVTRRDFWLGTMLVFALVSIGNGIAFAILAQLESATNGWWIGTRMFTSLWYGSEGFFMDAFTTFSLQMLVLIVGAVVTTIYMRWRMPGMTVFFAALGLALVVGIAALSFGNGWGPFFTWFGSLGLGGVFTLLLAVAAVLSVAGYAVIRKATPR